MILLTVKSKKKKDKNKLIYKTNRLTDIEKKKKNIKLMFTKSEWGERDKLGVFY